MFIPLLHERCLQGHYTPEMVFWLFAHRVIPLCTLPMDGPWLNMVESILQIPVKVEKVEPLSK